MELTQYIIEFMKEFNMQTVLSTFAIVWYFQKETNKKLDDMQSELKEMDKKLNDIDKRLYRVEGLVSSKECCMLKDNRQSKEAK